MKHRLRGLKLAALAAAALLAVAVAPGVRAQQVDDTAATPAGVYRLTQPTELINPTCNAGGPGVVGKTYGGVLCPQPGSTSTQPVSGSVTVSNFPATQAVTGSLSVTNFPATQTVAGTVAVSNFPATQPVSGSVTVSNFPATQTVAGAVSLSTASYTETTATTSTANSFFLVVAANATRQKLIISDRAGAGCFWSLNSGAGSSEGVPFSLSGAPGFYEFPAPVATNAIYIACGVASATITIVGS